MFTSHAKLNAFATTQYIIPVHLRFLVLLAIQWEVRWWNFPLEHDRQSPLKSTGNWTFVLFTRYLNPEETFLP